DLRAGRGGGAARGAADDLGVTHEIDGPEALGLGQGRDGSASAPGGRASAQKALDVVPTDVYIHVMVDGMNPLAQRLLETCLCHRARMATRAITRAYDDALRPTGLRATQLAVLAAVGARGALSIKSLADSLVMERTTLSRNLRPLEQQGY